jgi:hypothetical protein
MILMNALRELTSPNPTSAEFVAVTAFVEEHIAFLEA